MREVGVQLSVVQREAGWGSGDPPLDQVLTSAMLPVTCEIQDSGGLYPEPVTLLDNPKILGVFQHTSPSVSIRERVDKGSSYPSEHLKSH